MPTYEYACKECGEHLEVVQSFRDAALTECPNCQGTLRKVFSAAGIIFKGSGWHVKDYASSANRSGSAGSTGDGDSGGSESAKQSATSDDSGAPAKASSGSDAASGSGSSADAKKSGATSDRSAGAKPKATPGTEKKSA